MNYEDTYTECKAVDFAYLDRVKPLTGSQVQDMILHTTDESKLTERERLIMILTAVAYEVEHDMLTEELSDELYFYYQDLQNGKLDGILGENEKADVVADIEKYYAAVFNT